jgi:diguanylate cyclase (GGDEF)-like protein
MAEAASCDAGQAWLPSADGQYLECSPAWYSADRGFEAIRQACHHLRPVMGSGLAGRAWRDKQPVWIADLSQDSSLELGVALREAGFVAALGVPVLASNEVVAVLELYLTDANAQYQRLRQVATAMAAQLGTVIQRKQAEARLSYLAHYDVLTGLPNRVLFNDRLRQALVDAQRHGRLVGVAFVDLDRFKAVNDSLGHDVGDALLNGVAQRLCDSVRTGDTVARLSGDEFTIILADMRNVDDAARVASKILEAFASPFHINEREVFASPSLGIALFPLDHRTAEGLLRDADIAMYRAKQEGGNSYQFYRTEMTYRAAEKMALETGLRRAIERQELLLKYQPKVDVASGIITGVEALIRWQPQRADLVSPNEFVPLAEEIGLIVPIGEWALNSACAQIRGWQEAGLPNVRMAVNLSARQLAQPLLAGTVARVLEENRVEARWLELEITESLLMQNTREAVAMLEELSALGVRLVLDDFGTGYSSLSYLKRFPLHALKIDQSFVRGVPEDKHDAAIASAIIVLAHNLGLCVVAEGVETRSQFEFLREHNCDEVQGYLFGTPFAADEAAHALRAGTMLRS